MYDRSVRLHLQLCDTGTSQRKFSLFTPFFCFSPFIKPCFIKTRLAIAKYLDNKKGISFYKLESSVRKCRSNIINNHVTRPILFYHRSPLFFRFNDRCNKTDKAASPAQSLMLMLHSMFNARVITSPVGRSPIIILHVACTIVPPSFSAVLSLTHVEHNLIREFPSTIEIFFSHFTSF